jgi:hypothetical protein
MRSGDRILELTAKVAIGSCTLVYLTKCPASIDALDSVGEVVYVYNYKKQSKGNDLHFKGNNIININDDNNK